MIRMLIILLVTSWGSLMAQTEAQRIKAAEKELTQLTTQLQKLAEQPKPTRSNPVTANPTAARLVRVIEEFAALNEDLPLHRRARRLLANACDKSGNPARSAMILEALAMETMADGGGDALLLSARIRLRFGDPGGALKALQRLEADDEKSNPKPDTAFVANVEESVLLFNQQLNVVSGVLGEGRSGNAGSWIAARRFASTWPMATQSGQIVDAILKKLRRSPFAGREGYLRQIAFFFPKHKNWAAGTTEVVKNDAREGKYNTAITFGLQLLSRSEALSPGDVDTIKTIVDACEKLNAQIAARKLEIKPVTCARRYEDIIARLQTGVAIEDILILEQDFCKDYPLSSRVDRLRMAVAEVAASLFPTEAITRLKTLAAGSKDAKTSRQAALKALPLIVQEEGMVAAEEFISQRVKRSPRPADKAALLMAHSRILVQADRPEEALELLESRASELGDDVGKRLQASITKLRGKIGGS